MFEPIEYNIEPAEYIIPPNINSIKQFIPALLINSFEKNNTLHPFIKWHITSNTWKRSILIADNVIPRAVTKDTIAKNTQPYTPPIPTKQTGIIVREINENSITDYNYKFDIVKDEDIINPDISDCKIRLNIRKACFPKELT